MRRNPSFATIVAFTAVVLIPCLSTVRAAGASQSKGEEQPAQPPAEPAPAPTPAPAPAVILPDASAAKAIEVLRRGPLGTEHDAAAYLDLISAGHAKPAQVNDFAAYVTKRGMPKLALPLQEYAVRLDPNDPTLWANLGTIRRTNGSLGAAASAYKHSISIDPANALAHYNLGAVYDAEKNYDAAIEEYRRALVLDPDLADPRKNPQVVNNENLLAVKLEIYNHQAGALGLPLLQMQKDAPKTKPAPQKQ